MKKTLLLACAFLIFSSPLLQAKEKPKCDFYRYDGCHSCEELQSFIISINNPETNLGKCKNRSISYTGYRNSLGYLSELKTCPKGYIKDFYRDCVKKTDFISTYPGHYTIVNQEKCQKDKPLNLIEEKRCESCHFPDPVFLSSESNNHKAGAEYVCKNRVFFSFGAACPYSFFSQCPKDSPLLDDKLNCFSCEYDGPIETWNNPYFCRKFCDGKRFFNGFKCLKCSKDINYIPDKETCVSCGGYWNKTFCRKKKEGDAFQICHEDSDCAKGEVCLYDRCIPFTEEEKKGLYGIFQSDIDKLEENR